MSKDENRIIAVEQRLCQEYGIGVSTGYLGGRYKDQWFSMFQDIGRGWDWESDYFNTRREAEQAAIEEYERRELEGE